MKNEKEIVTVAVPGGSFSYEFTRKRIKNINIRVRRDGSVAVSAPMGEKTEAVDAFVRSKAEMILRASGEMKQKAEAEREKRLDRVMIRGEEYPIVVEKGKRSEAHFDGTALTVTVREENPERIDGEIEKFKKAVATETVMKYLEKWLPEFRRETKNRMPEIGFRNMKTRWGSCNKAKMRLHFSTALAEMPERFTEYVVLHELTHLKRADHSREFYRLMEEKMPDAKERRRLGRELGKEKGRKK